jgi:hypothetical protein
MWSNGGSIAGRAYAQEFGAGSRPEGVQALRSLYKVRHWFAHGAPILEMKDPTTRVETIGEGLSAVKEVLLAAYADDNPFAAAAKGAASVRKYLDSRASQS